jgi:hypothetical protein
MSVIHGDLFALGKAMPFSIYCELREGSMIYKAWPVRAPPNNINSTPMMPLPVVIHACALYLKQYKHRLMGYVQWLDAYILGLDSI